MQLNQYQLTFFTAQHPTPEPFVRVTSSLAEAVSIAWRNNHHGGRNVSIVRNEEMVFGEDELITLFSRMDEMEQTCPELIDRASQALREIRGAGINETLTQARSSI